MYIYIYSFQKPYQVHTPLRDASEVHMKKNCHAERSSQISHRQPPQPAISDSASMNGFSPWTVFGGICFHEHQLGSMNLPNWIHQPHHFARTRTWFWHLSRSGTEGIESIGWKLWNCRSWCHDPNVGTRSFHHFCVRITAVAEGIQRIFERISGCHRCRRHCSTRTHLPTGWNSCENLRK